jgi:hypothetical protein
MHDPVDFSKGQMSPTAEGANAMAMDRRPMRGKSPLQMQSPSIF